MKNTLGDPILYCDPEIKNQPSFLLYKKIFHDIEGAVTLPCFLVLLREWFFSINLKLLLSNINKKHVSFHINDNTA